MRKWTSCSKIRSTAENPLNQPTINHQESSNLKVYNPLKILFFYNIARVLALYKSYNEPLWTKAFHSQLSVNWIKCSHSNQSIKCGVDQPIGPFLYFFLVLCENFILYHNKRLLCADTCCHSVMKEFAHAFSCAYIESWMHLGSLESTQKARVTLGCASSYSYAFFMPSKLPACSHNLIYTQ